MKDKIIKKLIDAALDYLEEKIAESPTDLDDKFGLPLIAMIREWLGVPDND